MHEVSLVRSIINTLEEQFSEQELKRLKQIDLQIGVFSNVEPQLMRNAFEAVQKASGKYQQVSLHIESVPIKIFCEDCGVDTLVENYVFVCARCQKPSDKLTQGTELLIKRVYFED